MEFPHNNWYLKFTEKDREIVDNWRINIVKFSSNPCPNNTINYLGWSDPSGGRVEITIEQFKTHILNIEEPIIKQQDYSYLIPILNKLKIK